MSAAMNVLAFLPAATVARTVPGAQLWATAAGQMVHIGRTPGDQHAARCRVFAQPLTAVEDPAGRQVCVSCARRLPRPTRMHLATLGRPSAAELAAVREAEVLREATRLRELLEHHRTEAVLEGSISERVVFDGDPPAPHDYNGQRAQGVPLTLGLMIGALEPGAMTGGRLWLPGTPTSPARMTAPGGAGVDASFAPRGPLERERFRTGSGPRFGQVPR